ncbi:pitrilysin family protein [Homoserinibacter sp. GY 40078]|uniref:M16 family metallopeptidase n=1 Tax=Homoserinibacter sp. GY 40078 TaxID=2603275 RepID=UPI0011CCAA4E|nr:insulinase family protein [Homoserinibacter sp. GY 40078]TXK17276.1 insulinase family protein [Homoserinibacter sp. GY 40078]
MSGVSTRADVTEYAQAEGIVSAGEVDGVPVFYAPSPGPAAAGLMFRVGMADEPLRLSGISHLIEHLVLHGDEVAGLHRNGMTADYVTHFVTSGSEAEIVQHLNRVCAALRELPLERLETERKILRTEEQGRANGVTAALRRERHGASGAAVMSYSELGIETITPHDLQAWASERFTRDNAVLWITGDSIPEGLDLRLPSGSWRPILPENEVLALPAWIKGGDGLIGIDVVVPHSPRSVLFAYLLRATLFRVLRVEGGLSYSIDVQIEQCGPDEIRVTIVADALPEQQAAVVGEIVDTLAALRVGRIDDHDLDVARATMLDTMDDRIPSPSLLATVAHAFLSGRSVVDADDRRRLIEEVTLDQLREQVDAYWEAALWRIPSGGVSWAGIAPAPRWSSSVVEGSWFAVSGSSAHLVVGEAGVSSSTPEGPSTVLFEDCVACLAWPDGRRILIGADAFVVEIEPTLVPLLDRERRDAIDAAVTAVMIARPPRSPWDIPQPPVDPVAPRRRGLGVWALVVGSWLGLFGLVGVAVGSELTGSVGQLDSDGMLITPSVVITSWVLVGVCAAGSAALIAGWIRRVRWRRSTVGKG